MDFGLKGKHVLITGSSGGIGIVTAEKYLQLGANVSLHFHKNKNTLSKLLSTYPTSTHAVQADATDEQAVQQCVKQAIEKFKRIDILVLNHGIEVDKSVHLVDMDYKQWKNTLDINLNGFFLFAREYLKQLRQFGGDEGNIVMVGSTAGLFGEAGHSDYATSKSGLMYGLLYSLKNEIVHIAKLGRVNVVAPGWVKTPMAEKALSDKNTVAKVFQTMPLRKIAEPEDVANAIVFLSSKLAGHVNGNILTVHGGMEGRVLFDKNV